MRAIFYLCLSFAYLCALDATIEIVKGDTPLPSIKVEHRLDPLSSKIAKSLHSDLRVSSHFNVEEHVEGTKLLPNPTFLNFMEYVGKYDLLVQLETTHEGGVHNISLKLFDVGAKNLLLNKIYVLNNEERYPFIAHKIAIDINAALKAPSIEWMQRFIIFSKYVKGGSEIVIADYSLTYQKTLIGGGLNIFPKWANAAQDSFYFTKYNPLPSLVKYNIYTGKMETLLKGEGMLVASDVSLKGDKLLLTMSPNTQADIYLYDVNTKALERITNYSGIDVSANFIDGEEDIIFISDRLGYPNIFTLNLKAKVPKQLVFHGRNNSSVHSFSSYVVYSSRESDNEFGTNVFNLYLVSTKSDYIRRLTATGVNIMPRFSIDGETILFLKDYKNESALGILRLNYNKSYLFPLQRGKIQAIDW